MAVGSSTAAWPPMPGSPPSPAKRATQAAIDCPSPRALQEVRESCSQPDSYFDVRDTISDTLTNTLTDDVRRLRNALWLVEHLLLCTPQLMDDLCAEPGMLRGLLGYWAEDEFGHDCGEDIRVRASQLLSRLEEHEQAQLLSQRCFRQVSCRSSDVDSPTNSEDSETSAFTPFTDSGATCHSHAPPATFHMPSLSFKLPKLKLRRSSQPQEQQQIPTQVQQQSLGKPPLSMSGLKAGGALGSTLGSSLSIKQASVGGKQGSQDLVVAWGQIRGQNSSDFARMLQLLDDQCFDRAQEAYEASFRQPKALNPTPAACAF